MMALAAFIIGIPMFFEVGLIMLLPLIFTIAKKLEDENKIKGSAYVAIGVIRYRSISNYAWYGTTASRSSYFCKSI